MIDLRFVPLERWPRAKTPSGKRIGGPFKAKYSDTLDMLEKELKYLGAKDITIEAGFARADIRNDGWPRGAARPTESGVLLSFTSKHGAMLLPCDHFKDWQDNIRAIAYHLQHLRLADLYGVSVAGEQYKGWMQLPEPGGTWTPAHEDAAALLQRLSKLDPARRGEIRSNAGNVGESCYRVACTAIHPDRGGERATWDKLQAGIGLLREYWKEVQRG